MKHLQKEMEQYVEIVDKVAIISKTNLTGIITFVNDIFCEVSGYSREELIGKPHSILRHPDMPKSAFANLWETIKSGKSWNGKVKNKAKDGSAYHVNAYIFPIHNEDGQIVEYMAVRFLMTDEIEEQRKFKAQVRDKLSSEKIKQQELNQEIQRLNEVIKTYKAQNTSNSYAMDQLEAERKNKKKLAKQVNSYENEFSNMSKITESTINNAKKKAESATLQLKLIKEKLRPLEIKNSELLTMTKAQSKQIEKYEASLRSQAKIIEDLKDVIKSLENDKEKLLKGESLHSF